MGLNTNLAAYRRRSSLRKIAANKDNKKEDKLDFGKVLQNRNVRTGLAGLSAAALAKLLGAGWGTSAAVGAGAAGLAHFGQKAYDRWDKQRKYDALSPEQKIQLEMAEQDRLMAAAGVTTERNKAQVEAKKRQEYDNNQLAAAKATTAKIRAMTPEQLALYKSIEDAEKEETELAEDYLQGLLDERHKEITRPQRSKLLKLKQQVYAIQEQDRRKKQGMFDFRTADWLAGPRAIRNWFRSEQPKQPTLAELTAQIAALEKEIEAKRPTTLD